jgi:hypothetical protein
MLFGYSSAACADRTQAADRQLAAQTYEKGVENGNRQVGSPDRLTLFGFPNPTAP